MGQRSSSLVRVGKIKCKTIMGKSGIGSVDYAVNPYLGCEHGCVYCYARFMSRMGHLGEEWGSFVDVKINALERLRVEAVKRRPGVVLLSSVTDPYQPIERVYKLTRGSLMILLENQLPVEILTKSDLVLRDIDILNQFDDCEVGFTITTADENVRNVFEPKAPPIKARVSALRRLSDIGLNTYVFLGPLLPFLSEEGIETVLDELSECVDRAIVDRLNIKSGNLGRIRQTLSEHFPYLKQSFEVALSSSSIYYEDLKDKLSTLLHERGIPYYFCY